MRPGLSCAIVMLRMKERLALLKAYYNAHPKRFWAGGVIVVLAIIIAVAGKPDTGVTAVPVRSGDLAETVRATGRVTSETDLALSFSSGGIVARLPVAVGDKVYAGQVLASLDNRNEYASLKSAQANYQKVLAGSSTEEVAVAEASLNSAKAALRTTMAVQDTLVANAYRGLLNTDLTPVLAAGTSSTVPTVTGTYAGQAEGSYEIVPRSTGSGGYFTYTGVESGTGTISTTGPTPLGSKGLYVQFPSSFAGDGSTTWSVRLPNASSASYLSDYNAYQNAQKTRESAVSAAEAAVREAEANLALKKAAARPADLAVAQAQVDAAEAVYARTLIVAPASGTVTLVDTKVGERADAQQEVIVVQNVTDLYVEADINETNIAKVALGQQVAMTLDAFGPDVPFEGTVAHIDPAATIDGGVVNYKIRASIADASGTRQVRPGMNANMTITAWKHEHVLAIPKAAIYEKDGAPHVNVIVDARRGKEEPRRIETGLVGDGELVEVLSGLAASDTVAVSAK